MAPQTNVYVVDDDVYYATPQTAAFRIVHVPSRGDVLFYSPSCSTFYFPADASLEIIQKAAVAAAVYRLYMCWQRMAITTIAPIIAGIPNDILDMAFALTAGGTLVPSLRPVSGDTQPTNPRRLGYLTDGPVDLDTFTSIVYDAYPTMHMAALWTSCRERGRDLGVCYDINQEYEFVSTPFDLMLWVDDHGITEDKIHPSRRKKLIDGTLR